MRCKPTVNRGAKMVPEGGFEPPTRGFSINKSSNDFSSLYVNQGQNAPNRIKDLQNACKPSNAQIIAELTRAKCAIQLQTVLAAMGLQEQLDLPQSDDPTTP